MKEIAVIEEKDIVSVFTTENGVDVFLKSFIDNGVSEECAKTVMGLIAKGLIKNVSIAY